MEFSQTGSDGAVDNTQQSQGGAGDSQVSASAAEPTIIDIAEDAMVRIGGPNAKPVKFGDYSRGFQSQFTKASQRAAQLEKELQAERAERTRIEQERQRFESQRGGNQPNALDKISELPYLTGKETADLVRQIGEDFKQRDMVLLNTLKELQKMQQIVNTLSQSASTAGFDSKIDKFLEQAGLGKGWRDIAVETYLAYEPGPDLDAGFLDILNARVAQVRKEIEAERAMASSRAKQNAFVPGRGGAASPSRPTQLDPKLSARDVAETLWEQLQTTGT